MNRLKLGLMTYAGMIFLIISAGAAAGESKAEQSKSGVKREVTEAAGAIKDYSVEQRDQMLKKAESVIDDLDREIETLENRIEKGWDKMSEASRKKARESLKELRKQRNKLAEWYGGLKHSSANAWNEIKKGFIRSYEDMRDAFERAKEEL